jgi:hypothetical protein
MDPRGDPEFLFRCRPGLFDKVGNLERGGRLERVKPTFSLVILWRAAASLA